jgi:hypothetical protein
VALWLWDAGDFVSLWLTVKFCDSEALGSWDSVPSVTTVRICGKSQSLCKVWDLLMFEVLQLLKSAYHNRHIQAAAEAATHVEPLAHVTENDLSVVLTDL